MALNPPSGIVKWFNTPIGERGWNSFRAELTGKNYPGTSRKTSYVKLSDKETEEVIENIKKDSEGIPLFDEANAPDKREEYQRWLVARYLTKTREEGFEGRKEEGLKELEEELGPEGLDELLGLIREEAKVAVAAGSGSGGGGSTSIGSPPPPPTSSSLAVVPKKSEDLVEEEIDSQILSILGLEDVFDFTYEEYATLLREAAAKGRMPNSQMSTESIELVTEEFKRVRNKTGRFKVKPKKVDINKVLDKRRPSPQKVQLDPSKLLPPSQIIEEKTEEDVSDFKEAIIDELDTIGDKLDSLLNQIREEDKQETKQKESKRRKEEKEKKQKRESKLESKSKVSKVFEKVTKPFVSFFDRIKQFFLSILIGSAINFLLNVIKNPSIILNPLRNLVNGVVNFLNGIINWIWNLVISPINFVINSINTGIQGAINVINGALRLLGQPQISSTPIQTLPTQSPVQIPTWNAPVQQQTNGGQVLNTSIQQQTNGGQVVNVKDLTFTEGGSITNNSGITISGLGKDTRLVAAEPGEVMMSNNAGNFWGRDTLLTMNAMGGGTNTPKFSKIGISAMQGGGLVNPTPKTNIATNKGGYAADTGLDIHGKIGDPIVAPASGTLEYATTGRTAQAGQDSDPTKPGIQPQHSFRIRLDNPFEYAGKKVNFIYGTHLSEIDPSLFGKSNIKINKGQYIGKMGQANNVPHLHIGFVGDRQQSQFLDFREVKSLLSGVPSVSAQIASSSPSTNIPSPPSSSPINPVYIGNQMILPAQSSSPPVSSASGNQSNVPSFSSEDPNNMTSLVVKSIYNLVG